jgi:hypothetical protein
MNKPSKPEKVQAGQIWRYQDMECESERVWESVVESVSDGRVNWAAPNGGHSHENFVLKADVWSCIGVQLHDGRRVMVGELRNEADALSRTGGRLFRVVGVVVVAGYSQLEVEARGESVKRLFCGASFLADLPLVTETAPIVCAEPSGPTVWTRERATRECDRILREDARRRPAFAVARRAAFLAWAERNERHEEVRKDLSLSPVMCTALLEIFNLYEERRGGARTPSPESTSKLGEFSAELAAYERARKEVGS